MPRLATSGKTADLASLVALALVAIALGLVFACGSAPAGSASLLRPDGASDAESAASQSVEPTLAAWLEAYPDQARRAAANALQEASPTGYGGSIPFQRSTLMPELAVNFKGNAFSTDYKEDRGHYYAWQDLVESGRIGAASPASCISCKTPEVAEAFNEKGWAYAKEPLAAWIGAEHESINCFSCHDAESAGLKTVQPAFREAAALLEGAEALAAANPEVAVCAQCHSEYYFEPGALRQTHPWSKGTSAAAIYAVYETAPSGFTGDFVQGDSGARMLKAQHPDFEEYSRGVHAAAGVSCVDCHMPAIEEGGKSFTEHRVTSPLRNVAASCLPCHQGWTEEGLSARVQLIQDSVFEAQGLAGRACAEAHAAIAKAQAAGLPASRLNAARRLVREAQWRWDFVASANSMGFHNPLGAMGDLAASLDLARKALATLTP